MSGAKLEQLYASERPVAIVYPAFSNNCYGVIRSLGEQGIPVIALDEHENPNFASRYCEGLLCPSPKTDPDAFASFLAELGSRFRTKPVLFLMEDLYVYLAHRYREVLEPRFRFPFMSEAALMDCVDKRRTFEVAAAAGIALPKTWYPGGFAELNALREELVFPVILKPIVARFDVRDGEVGKICAFPERYASKAVQADDWQTLLEKFEEVLRLDVPCCIQELIPGDQECLFGSTLYVDAAGDVLGVFVRTKIRQVPWDFGTMTLGRAAASPEVVEASKRLVQAIGFKGICGLEFKYDARDNTYKLLEINPRGEQWMNLASRCGVDLPVLKYQDLCGAPIRAVQTDFSRRIVDLRDDFSLYFMKYRHDVGAPHRVSFGAWLRSLLQPNLVEVVFNLRDPMPGLLRFAEYARRVVAARLPGGERKLRTVGNVVQTVP